ncbi:hypothetical protein VCHA29O37_50262 [Vibrio chagasii]|nr:hypothetical protein VCHA29O37_50262 [Vibrio chagasii]
MYLVRWGYTSITNHTTSFLSKVFQLNPMPQRRGDIEKYRISYV